VAVEDPPVPLRAGVSHHSPMWLKHMHPSEYNPDWGDVVADIECVLNDEAEELESLGRVELTVVTDEYQLEVALRGLRQSCEGADILSSTY
jgi:hypothetical protein